MVPRKFSYIWYFQQFGINATKFKKREIILKVTLFAAVAVVDAKAPCYLNQEVNLHRYRKILLSFSFRLKQKLWKGYITCISKEIINWDQSLWTPCVFVLLVSTWVDLIPDPYSPSAFLHSRCEKKRKSLKIRLVLMGFDFVDNSVIPFFFKHCQCTQYCM